MDTMMAILSLPLFYLFCLNGKHPPLVANI